MQAAKTVKTLRPLIYLNRDVVHIFIVDVSRLVSEKTMLGSYLNKTEKTRYKRFRFEKDANQFLVTRGLLRFLAGKYLNNNPEEISFSYNKNGKPFVSNAEYLQFNVSHSKHISVIAFSSEDQIGIDIESINTEVNFKAVCETTFSDEEKTFLKELSSECVPESFFKIWTQKEAYIKMLGSSLALEIDENNDLERWDSTDGFFYDFDPAPGFSGTLATQRKPASVKLFNADISFLNDAYFELSAP